MAACVSRKVYIDAISSREWLDLSFHTDNSPRLLYLIAEFIKLATDRHSTELLSRLPHRARGLLATKQSIGHDGDQVGRQSNYMLASLRFRGTVLQESANPR